MGANRPGRQQGFVLVTALWAIAIVLAIAGAFDTYVTGRLAQAGQLRDHLQSQLDIYSTQQTLRYLLATQRITRGGLTTRLQDAAAARDADGNLLRDPVGGELLLDGSGYRGLGGSCFALQDENGLLAINAFVTTDLKWLLAAHEKDRRKVDELLDSLQDYRDEDTLSRLNGAEADTYRRHGLVPPTNYHLRAPPELYRVWGWSPWLSAHPDYRWWQWLGIGRSVGLNLNTMPISLLAQLPAVGEASAQRFVAMREQAPFRSKDDLVARTGVQLDWPEEKYRFGASNTIQLRLWSKGSRQLWVIALELTPAGLLGPWQQRYNYQTAIEIETDLACKPAGVHLFGQPGVPSG